jgi:hypothetical protein
MIEITIKIQEHPPTDKQHLSVNVEVEAIEDLTEQEGAYAVAISDVIKDNLPHIGSKLGAQYSIHTKRTPS